VESLSRIATLEAILFASGTPLSVQKLAEIIEMPEWSIQELLNDLDRSLHERGSGITLRKSAGGYQLATHPAVFSSVQKLSDVVRPTLSTAAMETLAIIAYKQPVTKQEVEYIRGVRAERSIARLVELELIYETGRKEVVGRPILYGTTDLFLRAFGLECLEGLPPLPAADALKDTLDSDQLRLFEEMQTAPESIDAHDAEAE